MEVWVGLLGVKVFALVCALTLAAARVKSVSGAGRTIRFFIIFPWKVSLKMIGYRSSYFSREEPRGHFLLLDECPRPNPSWVCSSAVPKTAESQKTFAPERP